MNTSTFLTLAAATALAVGAPFAAGTENLDSAEGTPPGYGYCSAEKSETVEGVTYSSWISAEFTMEADQSAAAERVAAEAGVSVDEVGCYFVYPDIGYCEVELVPTDSLPLDSWVYGYVGGGYTTEALKEDVREAIATLANVSPDEVVCEDYPEHTEDEQAENPENDGESTPDDPRAPLADRGLFDK